MIQSRSNKESNIYFEFPWELKYTYAIDFTNALIPIKMTEIPDLDGIYCQSACIINTFGRPWNMLIVSVYSLFDDVCTMYSVADLPVVIYIHEYVTRLCS